MNAERPPTEGGPFTETSSGGDRAKGSTGPVVIVLANNGRSALVKVPYSLRTVVSTFPGTSWNKTAKAWWIPSLSLPTVLARLGERHGCTVRYRTGAR